MSNDGNLIDVIAKKLSLTYLSDMRNNLMHDRIYSYITKLNKEEYSVKEWTDLYVYLSDEHVDSVSIDEIYNKLINYLKK